MENNYFSKWERLKQLLVQGAHLEGLIGSHQLPAPPGSGHALVHPLKGILNRFRYKPWTPGNNVSRFWV